ncbi:transcriptional regulator, LacI family [Nocardioides terrae]|uniref:Transcriptional regulator, LacI family n=1 Tax=Nocardioides terrae TaxID=574651 RepID=A0A1I1KCA6_9ACTN|nr:LacI family DNA-binding transcriptional regulator [Nocardioides terrae]SFC58115.1 transcriptional regulator, LacI family [Nocardioides terrae]
MPHDRPTVAQVARHAGVSVASVSRVLNDLPATEQTRAKVLAAVDELGYRPNAHARSLKVRRSQQLAFAVADVGNPVYVEMMRAVEDEARARGYRLLVSSTAHPDDMLGLLDSLEHGYADGLVISPVRVNAELVDALRRVSYPVVVVGSVPDDLDVDNVRTNSAAGVRLALEHLAGQGCRRVGFVNGPRDTVPGATRAEAFEELAGSLGLDLDPDLRVEAEDFTLAQGRKAASTLLDRTVPDAVLGANDLLAIATMHLLTERGLRVPQDVAVVGMDDTELADVTSPSLTSVDLAAHDRGGAAARLLLDRLEGPERPAQRVTIQPRLSVRGSSDLGGGRR